MVLNNQFTDEHLNDNSDNNVELANLSVLDMPNVRDIIINSRTALQAELSNTRPENISANDSALMDISQSDVSFSMIDTLQHHDIHTLTIDTDTLSDPRSALQSVFEAGDDALREQGFPSPDIQLYHTAQQTAQETGQDFSEALSDLRDAQPLMMRQDLLPKDGIEFMPDTDTVHAAPEVEGPVGEMAIDDVYDQIVQNQIDGTNFCELDTLSQFQYFLRVQPIHRGIHDDFISERIADSWESLPEEVRNHEPSATNIFSFKTPYPGWVDDVGAHENNQRFFGGYHISTEKGHKGVDVHFDAADPLMGPAQNALHGYEVGLLKAGAIESKHYPELGASLSEEGLAPDWDRYEEYCAGIE